MKRLAITLLAFSLSLVVQAQDEGAFPGVKGLMSEQEYRDAGLDKLSDSERQALDAWLIRYTAWEAPAIRQTVQEVKEVEKAFEITAKVKPPFKGWSTKTYFYLDNGQIWQQRNAGRYYYGGDDTAVRIRKNTLGFYTLEHIATGREIGVKRIK